MTHSGNVIQFRRGGDAPQAPASEPEEVVRGPQLENGYTKIAHELMEAIAGADLTAREHRVLWAVIRLTYGWNQKKARIYGADLANLTGMGRNRCTEVVSQLLERRVLERVGSSHSPMGINKNYPEWLPRKAGEKGKNHPNLKQGKTPQIGEKESPQSREIKSPQNGEPYKERKEKKDKTPNTHPVDAANRPAGDQPESGQEGKPSTPKTKTKLPACPHQDLLAIWAEEMPDQRQPIESLWQGTSRASQLAARWRQGFTITRNGSDDPLYRDTESGLSWWRKFFRFLRRSDFLMNKCRPFDLPWVCKPGNFQKIIELNYHEEHELPGGAS